MEKPLSFKLTEIASWQLDYDNSNVELPTLQRGFVWKVNQVESLWDSILRGFPIGSFLLSKSEDEKLFLLDGQQRATSIAIGYHDPWHISENTKDKFWSLKNIPIVWIDLSPKEKTNTHEFVPRVVIQSHPWGYQRVNHDKILSVPDRRNALEIFRDNPENNKGGGYFQLSLLKVFPYDSNLPIPLSFLIKAISEKEDSWKAWKKILIPMCRDNLPIDFIETKHSNGCYIEQLESLHISYLDNFFTAIKNLSGIQIPGIVVEKEILKADDGQTEDPTLFVRLNSSGTKIAGEELIYSIYKASFPEAKKLVESIGASFVAPSLVISLVSRLVQSELKKNYPPSISVNDFRKGIQNEDFKNKLKEFIGYENNSPAKNLFEKALDILLSKNKLEMPAVLVKNIVKSSPELFLLLLKRLRLSNSELSKDEKQKILATITALVWFGRKNTKYVREIWKKIESEDFWNKNILSYPFINKRDFIMYPLIQPSLLREYLLNQVVKKKTLWENLYPDSESKIAIQYKGILSKDMQESEIISSINNIWSSFIKKLFQNKSLVLFAQRKYINDSFKDFNQMETLEDTSSPWDWDHIFPSEWIHRLRYINPNTRHWNNCIGNLRAVSLEINRGESNRIPPKERLFNEDMREKSFVKDDWKYWSEIKGRINDGDNEMIANHLNAIINRLYNIYEQWYSTLGIGELFNFENNDS